MMRRILMLAVRSFLGAAAVVAMLLLAVHAVVWLNNLTVRGMG